MIIEFERSGGFAAVPLRLKVDTGALAPEARNNLEGLVAQAHFFDLPAKIPDSGGSADRFQYKLAVQDGQRSNRVETGEASIPADLQPLIGQLTAQARGSRGAG